MIFIFSGVFFRRSGPRDLKPGDLSTVVPETAKNLATEAEKAIKSLTKSQKNSKELKKIKLIFQTANKIYKDFQENGLLVRVENKRRASASHLGSRENKLVDGQPIPTTLIKAGLRIGLYGDIRRSNDWSNYCAVIYGSPNNDNDKSIKVLAANKKDFGSDLYRQKFSDKDFLTRLNKANTPEALEDLRNELDKFAQNDPNIGGLSRKAPQMNAQELSAKIESIHQRQTSEIEDVPIKKHLYEFLKNENQVIASCTDDDLENWTEQVKKKRDLDESKRILFQYALKKLKKRTVEKRQQYFDRAEKLFPAKYSHMTELRHNEVLVSTSKGKDTVQGVILRIHPTAINQAKELIKEFSDQSPPLFIYDHKTGTIEHIDSWTCSQNDLLEKIKQAMNSDEELPNELTKSTVLQKKIREYRISLEAEQDIQKSNIDIIQSNANHHKYKDIYKEKIILTLLNKKYTNIWFERLSPLIPEILEHWETNNKIQLTEALGNLATNKFNAKAIAEVDRALPKLINLLDDANVALKTNVVITLGNLATNDANKEKIAKVDDALPKLIALLDSSDVALKTNVVITLDNLAMNEANKKTIAAFNGIPELIKLLNDPDADLALQTKVTGTLFNLARNESNAEAIATFLIAGAKVDQVDKDGYTPLINAAANGHEKVVEILLKAGAKVDQAEKEDGEDGCTALMFAAANGHEKVVEILLKAKAKLDQADNDGFTSLMFAAYSGNENIVRALLAAGVDKDKVNNQDGTALMGAAKNGHEKVVEILLKAGAKLDQADNDGFTALMFAAHNGHEKVVEILLKAGAKVDQADKTDGCTALMFAAAHGHENVVRALLAAGADKNKVHNQDATALMLAAQNGHADVVRTLCEAGADKNKADTNGCTALIYAAHYFHADVVTALCEAGADKEKADNDGFTPLISSAYHGHANIVRNLIDAGANVKEKNKDGNTALKIAKQKGHAEVVRALYEADKNRRPIRRKNLLKAILSSINNIIKK